MKSDLLTAQELAKQLSLSVETVWKYTRQKRIPVVQLGNRQYRYEKDAVIAALSNSSQMTREESPSYGERGSLTYQDYLQMPDEPGYQIEIINGHLIKEPSPTVQHQRVSRRLLRILEDYFEHKDSSLEVFGAPLDVTLSSYNVFQPDLLVVSHKKQGIIEEARINGAPELVIEILSATSGSRDRVKKLTVYRDFGVLNYWIVDPMQNTVEAFRLRDGEYALVSSGSDADVFTHPSFPGLSIELEGVFKRSQ